MIPAEHRSLGPSRRQFLLWSTAAAATTAVSRPAPRAHASTGGQHARPNIILIVADDLGYGELGSYGQELIRTPNLDRLAADGIRFTTSYTGAAVCAPSRCTMLTGLHTGHCSVRENPQPGNPQFGLADNDTTLAEVLKTAGYRTACFGKWGFGQDNATQPSHPLSRGFDKFFGYITHRHAHDYYPELLWRDRTRVEITENANGAQNVFAPDLFADLATDFIQSNSDFPFFLYLPTNLPHAPQDCPTTDPYTDEDWRVGAKLHAAQITRFDDHVGRVLATLTERGLDDNTLVLVTSDNGPHDSEQEPKYNPDFFDSNGPLRGYKRNLYEGGIRTPLIAWSPRLLRDRAGSVSNQEWAFWDFLPTLADVGGAAVPADLDGHSMLSALVHGQSVDHDYFYWFRRDPYSTPRQDREDHGRGLNLAEAARKDEWKGVRFSPDTSWPEDPAQWQMELYNLREDLSETINVAGEFPEVAAVLMRTMDEAWVGPPYPREPYGLSIDPRGLPDGTEPVRVATTVSNGARAAFVDVEVELSAPDGWKVEPLTRPWARELAPGNQLRTLWRLSPDDDVAAPGPLLHGRAAFGYRGVSHLMHERQPTTAS